MLRQSQISGSMPERPCGNSRGFVQTALGSSGDARRLDRFFHRLDEETRLRPLSSARVLLVAFSPEQLGELRDHLRTAGVDVTAATPNVKQLSNAGEMGAAFTHILVNIDAFDDLETGIDVLSAFRKRFSHVVVLCSAHVADDDLGSERSTICDATLRLPVSPKRLRQGLSAASVNSNERSDC